MVSLCVSIFLYLNFSYIIITIILILKYYSFYPACDYDYIDYDYDCREG